LFFLLLTAKAFDRHLQVRKRFAGASFEILFWFSFNPWCVHDAPVMTSWQPLEQATQTKLLVLKKHYLQHFLPQLLNT